MELVYKIHDRTMVLIPSYLENGRIGAIIEEESLTISMKRSPQDIVEENCAYFGGATYEGQKVTASNILESDDMIPTVISLKLGLFLFQVQATNDPVSIWISHKHIKKLQKHRARKTKVFFKNGKQIILDLKPDEVMAKIKQTMLLQNTLEERNGIVRR